MPSAATKLTPKKRAAFLDALAECGNVSQAAKSVNTSRFGVYQLRSGDPTFAAAWDDAVQEAADKLEQEAWRRAHDGVADPVVSMGKVVRNEDGTPMMVQKYSDTLLIFLLKGARPEKYRDNVHVTAQQNNLGITVILEQMRGDRNFAKHTTEFLGQLAAAQEVSG